MSDSQIVDAQRRFAGLARLYGAQGLQRLADAHIAVAGLGGVGSWCAEALARSGIGRLTLIDLDHISESNINRQLHALTHTLGQSKVHAMGERIAGINPACAVNLVDDFVTPDNVRDVLAPDLSLLIDCTDQTSAKVAMILECGKRKIPIVVCGGAGGKTLIYSLRSGDLSLASNDALLSKLRNTLRRSHGYPKASDQSGKVRKRIPGMGVRALWFEQQALLPEEWRATRTTGDTPAAVQPFPDSPSLDGREPSAEPALQGLSCAGYGSAVAVTAIMGMAAANEAMECVLNGRFRV